jgi:hypothetical protein
VSISVVPRLVDGAGCRVLAVSVRCTTRRFPTIEPKRVYSCLRCGPQKVSADELSQLIRHLTQLRADMSLAHEHDPRPKIQTVGTSDPEPPGVISNAPAPALCTRENDSLFITNDVSRTTLDGAVTRTEFGRAKIGRPSSDSGRGGGSPRMDGFLSEDAERAAGC